MSTGIQTQRNTLVLLDEEHDGTVTVVPKDRDRFCVSVEQAVKACKLVDIGYSFVNQMADLRDHLMRWLADRRERVQSAYLSMRSSGILFVVVQQRTERDDALANDLTDLDLEIANSGQFNLLTFDVLSLPKA